jgi:methionyl-tRNA synthetase
MDHLNRKNFESPMENIKRSSQLAVTHEYNAFLQRLYPSSQVGTPFGSATVRVAAGTISQPHQHHEHETFVILEGQGTYHEDGRTSVVGPGDVIYIKPFSDHAIEAGEQDLRFLSIWWEGAAKPAPVSTTRHVIFTPPPTPNGDLHLGHLSGPYMSADILKRQLRQQGKAVRLIVGTGQEPVIRQPEGAPARAGAGFGVQGLHSLDHGHLRQSVD